MKWFTCIVYVENHVTRVQYFHTRAETVEQAEANALKWFRDGEAEDIEVDVPHIFEGKLEPVN